MHVGLGAGPLYELNISLLVVRNKAEIHQFAQDFTLDSISCYW